MVVTLKYSTQFLSEMNLWLWSDSQTVLILLAFQIIGRPDLTAATGCLTNCDLQSWRHTGGR